ncbi:uncharacterized protein EV422DRAFT_222923 [Fimicolochytrium jonesii]|uniref:uncharacterized protein n=1 Tax=Fimicolochytrium jonesii TaxID=1396493 RepID=UPI0022FDE9CF|nr:uncharacterized protein EV422DRAFT_222923 [Fimicolochytrium jonesii]KAI8817389.1 hypothetical protein EV422DRAFT_222923 [Fimicolochytrium jonesii]
MRRNSESFTFTGQPLNRTADGPLSSATPSRATTRGLSKKGFSNKLLYPGFRKDGIDYHLNDCVLVEAEDQDEPYKAMIIACYRDEEGTGKMDIRWIYAASEVERQLGTTAARTRKCRALELDPAEIVHTDMKEVKEDIEHICGKIEVLSRDEYRSRYPKSNPDGIYFCHRTLGSARDVKAWPMDWEAFRRNEDAPPFEKAEAMQKREGKAKEHAAARTPARTTRNETAAATPASAKPNSVRKATGRRKKEGWTEEEVGQAAPPRKSRGRSSVEESEEVRKGLCA